MIAYWSALILLDLASDRFNIFYNAWEVSQASLWLDRAVWFGAWIAVTPLLLMLLGGAYPGRFEWKRTASIHLLGHPTLIALQVLIASAIFMAADPSSTAGLGQHSLRLFLTVTLGRDLHAYAALVGIFYGLSLRKQRFRAEIRASRLAAKSAELSRNLTEVRLESLRREMNPHVLFNALNSIGTLMRAGQHTKAARMMASMSALLRAYLKPTPEPLVPLQEELDLLDRYLDMDRVRLEDRLRLHITVDPSALGASVPPFLLQPIVENAIKHGADRSEGTTLLWIDVVVSGDRLRIDVDNESDPPPERGETTEVRSAGIGLSNVRRRLDLLFGSEAGVEIVRRRGGARVSAWLPLHGMGASAAGPLLEEREAG